jgi:uncharacterized protein
VFLDADHPLHSAAVATYQDAVRMRRPIVTTNYIIAELAALLDSRLHMPRERLVSDVETLRHAPHLQIIFADLTLDEEAWTLLKSHADKHWSLVDAASFVLMRRAGITEALATDKHFTQAGFVRVPQQ